jgi:beta-lactamase class A
MRKNLKIILILIFLLSVSAAFFGGWFYREKAINKLFFISPLRLGGFKFVKPLLVCDTASEKKLPALDALTAKLTNYIDSEKKLKNVDSVSIYFQDLKTDGRIDINQDEKFNPASLTKVAVMMAFYRLAEYDSSILSQSIFYEKTDADFNEGQEIPPKDTAQKGNTYTTEILLGKMIKYSDSNSMALLLELVDPSTLQSLFSDLQVPFPVKPDSLENLDSITTKGVSYFFRVLYNSTYLTNDLSDKALGLLSETDYKNGLVAGVPAGVDVAHKYGLIDLLAQGTIYERELHDCGIVYHAKDPYLICVMTKSSSDAKSIENVIKNISALVYQGVDDYSK